MADTTIKVDKLVRDRLAVLAAERGLSIRDLVAQFAGALPTQDELAQSHARTVAYIRENLVPDFNDDDLAAGEALWARIAEGRRRPVAEGGPAK